MTTLVLIRHAAVDSGSRLYGWFDVPLSRAGQRAVEALRRGGSAPVPAALYSSPSQRAWVVASRLGELWSREPRACAALREIHCGALEGLRLEELERQFPALWARNTAQCDEDFTWPGGESYRCFRRRVLGALTQIAATHPGERIAVVTHSGVISQVLGAIAGRSAARWDRDRPDPLTATEVLWNGEGPHELVTYNETRWC